MEFRRVLFRSRKTHGARRKQRKTAGANAIASAGSLSYTKHADGSPNNRHTPTQCSWRCQAIRRKRAFYGTQTKSLAARQKRKPAGKTAEHAVLTAQKGGASNPTACSRQRTNHPLGWR